MATKKDMRDKLTRFSSMRDVSLFEKLMVKLLPITHSLTVNGGGECEDELDHFERFVTSRKNEQHARTSKSLSSVVLRDV